MYDDGHGAPGTVALSYAGVSNAALNDSSWGVGNTEGSNVGLPSGLPVTGRLKWMLFDTSDTTAAPASVDSTHPSWTANWLPAFGRPGGSLHGLYGAWQQPGTCNQAGQIQGRTCDITDPNNIGYLVAGYAVPYLNSAGATYAGNAIHDAWVAAVGNAGFDSAWSIWEDANARNDIISGPGSGVNPPSYTSNLSTTIYFYYSQSIYGHNVQSIAVQPQTFTLNPQNLSNENINHTALVQQNSSYLSNAIVTDDGVTYNVRQSSGSLRHLYGLSGAVLYAANSPEAALAFSQTVAQQAATSYVQGTLGMPADAH